VGYEANGVRYDYPPYHQSVLHEVKPIYEVLPAGTPTSPVQRSTPVARRGQKLHQVPGEDHGRHHLGGGRGSGPRAVRPTHVRRCGRHRSGAREHALPGPSPRVPRSWSRPEPGIAAHGITCVVTPSTELDAELFVIGPDQPVVDGLADLLRAQGRPSSDRVRTGRDSKARRRI